MTTKSSPPPLGKFTCAFGPYTLGDIPDGSYPVSEFTPLEYAALKKTFENEHILHVPPVVFMGAKWDMVLGTVDGCIYKIGAQLRTEFRDEAEFQLRSAKTHFCKQFVQPVSTFLGMDSWDSDFGTVTLDSRSVMGTHYVNITITSGILTRVAKPKSMLLRALRFFSGLALPVQAHEVLAKEPAKAAPVLPTKFYAGVAGSALLLSVFTVLNPLTVPVVILGALGWKKWQNKNK